MRGKKRSVIGWMGRKTVDEEGVNAVPLWLERKLVIKGGEWGEGYEVGDGKRK